MKILVLGGTRLVGRGFVEAALAAGHTLTLFQRGQTHPERFPQVERILGDRDGDLRGLAGRTWDAVFDPSASQPHRVQASLQVLAGHVGAYVFVSSVSVYAGPALSDETSARAVWDGTSGPVTGENYGGYKARCEDLVAAAMPEAHALLRLGLVVGPYDESARFNVFVQRAVLGGEMLAPGPQDAPVQVIDGRDAGEFAVRLIEQGGRGAFNLTGPERTMAQTLAAVVQGVGGGARLVWAPHEWLLTAGLKPWEDLPLWTAPEDSWLWRADTTRARALGLRCRPLVETVRDALEWERGRAEPTKVPLDGERERALIRTLCEGG